MSPRLAPEVRAANLALVAVLRGFAARPGATPAQAALAWCRAKRPWIVPFPGTKRMDRLAENLGATQVTLAPEILAELDQASASVPVEGPRLPAPVLAISAL